MIMKLTRAVLLCCLTTLFYSRSVNGITDCDGLICPDDTYCSVSSSSVDGKQQTVRTCKNSLGEVVARSFSTGGGMLARSHGSNVAHSHSSSSFVMGGGRGSCIHHTSTVNGITTEMYRCNIGNGNSYYVTKTNGEYKNCTSVPVPSDNGMIMQENCTPMSAEDIQMVKQMEEEMRRNAAEVQQRMTGMAREMQARNQEMQNRMMYNMENMKINMHKTFDGMFRGFVF